MHNFCVLWYFDYVCSTLDRSLDVLGHVSFNFTSSVELPVHTHIWACTIWAHDIHWVFFTIPMYVGEISVQFFIYEAEISVAAFLRMRILYTVSSCHVQVTQLSFLRSGCLLHRLCSLVEAVFNPLDQSLVFRALPWTFKHLVPLLLCMVTQFGQLAMWSNVHLQCRPSHHSCVCCWVFTWSIKLLCQFATPSSCWQLTPPSWVFLCPGLTRLLRVCVVQCSLGPKEGFADLPSRIPGCGNLHSHTKTSFILMLLTMSLVSLANDHLSWMVITPTHYPLVTVFAVLLSSTKMLFQGQLLVSQCALFSIH